MSVDQATGAGTTVLLTGPPRSGTTLACELLNMARGVVALDEPMSPEELSWDGAGRPGRFLDPATVARNVTVFADAARVRLVADGTAPSKNVAGRVIGDRVGPEDTHGRRRDLAERSPIRFDEELSPDFTLVIKHNAAFTASLEHLVLELPVFAVVRSPLAVLASWQRAPWQQRRGLAPLAQRLDDDLRGRLAAVGDGPDLDRQLVLLDWWFERLATLPPSRILHYETIVATGGAELARIAPTARVLAAPLASRNGVNPGLIRELAPRLLETDGSWWRFYDRSEVCRST